MIIDSHSHLNFATFKEDAENVIQRSLDNNTWMINVGSQLSTSKRAIELARKYSEGVYAAVGLHPIHVSPDEIEEDEEYPKEKYVIDDLDKVVGEIKKLASEDKVVAIGEVGLDYFHLPDGCNVEQIKKWQKEYLVKFIELAGEVGKPLILHCRGDKESPLQAYEDLLEVLATTLPRTTPPTPPIRGECGAAVGSATSSPLIGGVGGVVGGVIHCFGANLEIAKKFIDLGFKIGFTGIVTFKNAKELQEVAAGIDLDNILIETDCPYLAPEPFRGKRNEPFYVKYVAEKIAEIKGVGVEEIMRATSEKARKVFGI